MTTATAIWWSMNYSTYVLRARDGEKTATFVGGRRDELALELFEGPEGRYDRDDANPRRQRCNTLTATQARKLAADMRAACDDRVAEAALDFVQDPSLLYVRREVELAHTVVHVRKLRKVLAAEQDPTDPEGHVYWAAVEFSRIGSVEANIIPNPWAWAQMQREIFRHTATSDALDQLRRETMRERVLSVLVVNEGGT